MHSIVGTDCDYGGLPGLCMSGECEDAGLCDGVNYNDGNECTADTCDPHTGTCLPVMNGAPCDYSGFPGLCMSGTCESVYFSCDEQGIRAAIAAGGGPHKFRCNGPTTVTTNTTIVVGNDVILDGESKLTVDGDQDHRVFYVSQGTTAELRNLTVTGRRFADLGAGIRNDGNLTLVGCSVSGNEAFGDAIGGGIGNNGGSLALINTTVTNNRSIERDGGGIYSRGELTMTDSEVTNNRAAGRGGGVAASGTVTLVGSMITLNTSSEGAGIWVDSGNLTLLSSTLGGNSASEHGGGIASLRSDLTVGYSSIAFNAAPSGSAIEIRRASDDSVASLYQSTVSNNSTGIAIFNNDADFALRHVTLADNAGSIETSVGHTTSVHLSLIGSACSGVALTSYGFNVESDDTCGLSAGLNQVNVGDLKLDPIDVAGEPPYFRLPMSDSPALDVAAPMWSGECLYADDQRGIERP